MAAPAKRLNPRVSYNLTVKHIKANDKRIPKNGMDYFVNRITFIDKNQEEYNAEFLTTDPQQTYFVEGSATVFKVVEVQQLGDVIVPIVDSLQTAEKVIIPNMMPTIQGHSFQLAMQHATDLMCTTKQYAESEQIDIDLLLNWADRIDEWFIEKITERETGERRG